LTWVIGASSLFGYGVMISDVRVTFRTGETADILRKAYPVGPYIVAGFAGSVLIGFQLLQSLHEFLFVPPSEAEADRVAWKPEWVAEHWAPEARKIFAKCPFAERKLGSHFLMVGVSPDENMGTPNSPRVASGIPFDFELRLRRFDGEYRWFENRHVPIRDDSGRIARWYLLLTDIEDRTRALARLDQMQSDFAHINRVTMMGELVASLSHEITQPIASARNNASAAQNFLDMQPPDLGEAREALRCVVGDTDRAGDMIDRIRDHIKKAPPRKGEFDLNEAINEVIVLGRSAIIKNGVSVQTRLSEELFPIHGDRVQLQQVVLNLLLNAVEAMGSREAGARELSISTEQDHRGALVVVRDSGPGIDPSHLERVFDAFYTTKSSGMGMGLSICRSIIEAHGGRLWASANPPRGANFQFALPAIANTAS
jgi:signal transduction histidine kinase